MNLDELGATPAALWLIGAVLLGIAELVVPGVFLVFLAIAAAVTAALVFLLPDVPVAVQLLSFGLWSAVAVLVGRRLYSRLPVPTSDPLLNDRGARLIGQVVRVTEKIEDGRGRVRVGDGEWPASGPDAPVGAKARVEAVEGGLLKVAPLE
ncbi:MAG: NfeD family protein [Pseudomonadota bacterium]